jgi:hypothetical protein
MFEWDHLFQNGLVGLVLLAVLVFFAVSVALAIIASFRSAIALGHNFT